jgi:hypothetical protein
MYERLIERYRGKVVCDHAEKCGNQECYHGWPHVFENVKGCHCTACYRVKDATPKCRPFAEIAREKAAQ